MVKAEVDITKGCLLLQKHKTKKGDIFKKYRQLWERYFHGFIANKETGERRKKEAILTLRESYNNSHDMLFFSLSFPILSADKIKLLLLKPSQTTVWSEMVNIPGVMIDF